MNVSRPRQHQHEELRERLDAIAFVLLILALVLLVEV